MARSTKIYVLYENEASRPDECFLAAFTVKHEMVTWCQRAVGSHQLAGQREYESFERRSWQLAIHGDGLHQARPVLGPLPACCFQEWDE